MIRQNDEPGPQVCPETEDIDLAKNKAKKTEPTAGGKALSFFTVPIWGQWLAALVFLWVLLAIVYGGAMTGGQVFQAADTSNAAAFAAAGDKSLAEGVYPLWNPYLFAGMPSFGSAAYLKYVYPPSMIFNTLQGWGLPPLTWMFGHLLFGGLGMIWMLRRWELPWSVLLLGAVIFLLFPKVVAWGVHGHGSKLGAAMYMPWIVGAVWRILDGRGWRYVGLAGLLVGLMFLRSHPQISFYTLGLVVWLVLWNAVWPLDRRTVAAPGVRWGRAAMVVPALVVGFMLAAVLMIPQYEYSNISIRGQDTAGGGGVGLDYATGWSMAPGEYGSTLFPMAVGFGKATYLGFMPFNDYPNYFGILLVALALAAWSCRRERSLMVSLLVMVLLAVFVSFGRHGFGFYEWLYGWLPFFNKFRIPSMIMVLPAFAAAILAPLSVSRLVSSEQTSPGSGRIRQFMPMVLVMPMVLAGLGLLILLMGGTGMAEGFYRADLQALAQKSGKAAPGILLDVAWSLHRNSLVLIGLILMTAGAAAWASTRSALLKGGGLAWVLLILVAVDLGAVDRLIVHPDRGLQTVVQDPRGGGRLVPSGALLRDYHRQELKAGPGAEALKDLVGHDRVFPLGAEGSTNAWMADGVRSLGGYSPVKMASFEQIRKRLYAGQSPAMRLAAWLSGRVVSFGAPFSEGQLHALRNLGADFTAAREMPGGPVFYTNAAALPRARLLTHWRPVQELPEKDALAPFLDGIQSGTLDFHNTVTLSQRPDPEPIPSNATLPTPVFVKDGMQEVVLDVDTPVPALLLLADMMAPGWQVQVDGQERPLLTADLVLRAVALEAGTHEVRFHYSDPTVSRGLTLSVAGGILTLMMIVFPSFLPRSRRSGEGTGSP